jgi:hypothetical protein
VRIQTGLAVGLLFLGCGTKSSSSQSVGSTGGNVSTGSGVAIDVPSGALSANTNITIAPLGSTPAPSSALVVGGAYVFGPEGQQFTSPVTVTLPINASDLPPGATASDVVILTAPQGSTSFVSLGATVLDSTHVQTTTTHFSVFVPAVLGVQTDAGFIVDAGASTDGGVDGGHDAGHPDAGCPNIMCNGGCFDNACQCHNPSPSACGFNTACQVCDAGMQCLQGMCM